ncbi:GNAT family N-acetyltransferase [Sinomicrobium sp. FJxs]|uniref:GNAT family N-acetyltransferase n=2 Tax=Sinomicrobium weinanense TaxID=2842200 RepID=A0A926JRB9_9FLAO|nr:GNAT family N-acetyltransferase [Sinomicrobium weinanense]MBU3122065.1 GNAT family N-acetyltransferase [Sinomicrobium weinanense]
MEKTAFYTIKQIGAKETYPVRHPVLRKGLPLSTCEFDGDDDAATFHIGLYMGDRLAGVVTMLENDHALFKEERQFQLRGMAVLEEFQKQGLGQVLVRGAEEEVQKRGGHFIWMNARKIAVKFYEKLGYTIASDEFVIETAGPHYVMCKSWK